MKNASVENASTLGARLADHADYRDPEPFFTRAAGLDLTFYPAGKDRIAALLEMIGGASVSLRMFSYFMADDRAGQSIRQALLDALKRGVSVEVLVDGFGTQTGEGFFAPLRDAGAKFARFSPRWGVQYLIRNHQKITIADDRLAMVGGFNLADGYFDPPERNGWNDLGVKVEGDQVAGLVTWYEALSHWCHGPQKFVDLRRLVREWEPGDGAVQWLAGGPTRAPNSWARRVRRDMAGGRRLDLVMAYFSPLGSYRNALRKLLRQGRARLVMAAKSDNGATIGASRSLYRQLLRGGARIIEFQPCKLHTKLIVIDDVSYIGSANFDMRSLRLNLELMLRIEDSALADQMRAYIDHYEAASEEITFDWLRDNGNWWTRIRWRISWFLVSVLDYSVTRRLNLGL